MLTAGFAIRGIHLKWPVSCQEQPAPIREANIRGDSARHRRLLDVREGREENDIN